MSLHMVRMCTEQALLETMTVRYDLDAPALYHFDERERKIAFTGVTDKLSAMPGAAIELHHTGESRSAVRERFRKLERKRLREELKEQSKSY